MAASTEVVNTAEDAGRVLNLALRHEDPLRELTTTCQGTWQGDTSEQTHCQQAKTTFIVALVHEQIYQSLMSGP